MNISVLGCGRWGSFLSWYFARQKNDVVLFGNESSKAYQFLKQNGRNEYVELNPDILLTSDLEKAVAHAEAIVISINSQGLREFIGRVVKCDPGDRKIILCMKGIESETCYRLSQVVVESGIKSENVAVWVGPGHIQEFVSGKPNCMVIDSENKKLTKYLADSFKSDLIRFYYGEDLIGSEIGAASKNVIGIVAGMLDGANLTTLKGPLMARGAREVARLVKAMGGNELSAYGLCHLGDYETTLFSEFSHNRRFGEAFVKGERFEKLAEGVMTAKALKGLGEKYNVELPITNAVYNTLFLNNDWHDELPKLFGRATRNEFD